MSLFVYVTERCLTDANEHSIEGEMQRFKERVESTQSTSPVRPLPSALFGKEEDWWEAKAPGS